MTTKQWRIVNSSFQIPGIFCLSKQMENGLSTILMVGGFSECPLIQDAVQAAFPDKRIIIPEDAGMSVLKGAVLFGHRPDTDIDFLIHK
jgi:molecular chaperone DnaK (HSP70)